ncbi:MAG: hypothetical protein HKN51_02340 [Saprospiraceae bacterium]|nr:hypothetical protein [Saprospiraceae bacterium]
MKYGFTLLLLLCSFFLMDAQEIDFDQFKAMKFRNIGPAGMSGRITAIDVNLRDKDHIFVGSASGGVWESKNGGISWKPIFDDQPTLSIGALKINQNNPAEIWVGTGEGNPRNSHNSGAGVFKTVDGGKTWTYMGLKETKLIHRIIINEHDPNTVLVGAMGSAWGTSSHRGVYKTTDGGATWEKTLYIGDNVGIADMVADPSNPNKIMAAMWEFGRTPWGFNSGGKGSGIHLSYDGGSTWKKLTDKEGMPKGDMGRVGLAFSASKPNIVYALIEAKTNGLYKSVDGGEKFSLVSSKNIGNRPFYYAEIYVDPQNENRIYNLWSYVSKSEDGGKTFKTIMDYGNSVHPDHHAFWIDPDDSNYLIDGNDGGLNISRDGSKTWRFVQNLPVGQFYHVDVDNDFPYNIYGGMQDNGSWVGPGFVLKSGGIRNYDWQELYFGDGFDVAPRKDNNRYGYAMSQGGNIGLWDKVTGRTEFIKPQHPDGEKLRYNWNAALALDARNDCGLYFGSQFVHYSDDCGKSWKIISPDLTTNDTIKQNQSKSGGLTLDITGAENHTTILAIAPSPHDESFILVGTDDGNLQVTNDGGDSWNNIANKLPGLPKNAWIPQIEISKINPNEIFVVVNNYRMNDWSAFLYHSTDKGLTWRRIVDDSDVDGFVCSVVQDPEHDDLIFLGTDVGLYFSLDHGNKWIKWEKGFPPVQVRDMKIQSDFDDLILGTFGRSFWVLDDIKPLRELSKTKMKTLDEPFKVFETGIAYQTSRRSYDGIRFNAQGEFIGDNRRGGAVFNIWNKPKDKEEAEMKKSSKDKKEKKGKKNKDKSKKDKDEKGEMDKKPEAKKKKDGKKVKILAINAQGDTVRTFKRNIKEGLNRIGWRPDAKGVDFPRKSDPKEKSEPGGMPIIPGTYKMVFFYKDYKDSVNLEIALDPRIDKSYFDPEAKYDAMSSFNGHVEKITKAFNNLKEAKKSMKLYKEIIDVQPDSIKKMHSKTHKTIGSQIDSLMNLYMLPEAKKVEYRDDSHTLMNKVYSARRFLGTSAGAPTENGQHAIKTAIRETKKVLTGINSFFEGPWSEYVEDVKALPVDIFKSFDPIDID